VPNEKLTGRANKDYSKPVKESHCKWFIGSKGHVVPGPVKRLVGLSVF